MKREISNNRTIEECNGFYVIKPKFIDEVIPLFCPVCKRMMCQKDVDSYKKFNCCEDCDMYWARVNLKKWKLGWRPTDEEVKSNINEKSLDIINVLT